MAIDHSQMRLGKRARRHDRRTLKLARYITASLPHPPVRVDYTDGLTDWGVMLNNQLGCCTIAAVGHAIQAWRLNAGPADGSGNGTAPTPQSPLPIPDSAILNYYQKWDGYNPANSASDQGGVELDVLNDWRQQGFNGHALDAYVAIHLGTPDAGNGTGLPAQGTGTQDAELQEQDSGFCIPNSGDHVAEIATAIWLFGGAYIGVELPLTAQNQEVWDVPARPGPDDEPGSWGGHAVYVVGYDSAESGVRSPGSAVRGLESEAQPPLPSLQSPAPSTQTLTCITWGQPKKMTWAWFQKYCSEAYALVSKDWLNANGISPSGFDLATLENDLKLVTT